MSTIYPPNELEIQALHREEIKGEAATKTLFRLYCTLSQSLYSSYRGIDRSWPPLPGLERQEFGAFCRKGFADNLKKKKKNRCQCRGVLQEQEQESNAGSYH